MRKILYMVLFLFVAAPVLQSCGSSRSCGAVNQKKKFAKKNYWKPKKKHKRSKWVDSLPFFFTLNILSCVFTLKAQASLPSTRVKLY